MMRSFFSLNKDTSLKDRFSLFLFFNNCSLPIKSEFLNNQIICTLKNHKCFQQAFVCPKIVWKNMNRSLQSPIAVSHLIQRKEFCQ